jgi:DnaJ-class molecular chaperone
MSDHGFSKACPSGNTIIQDVWYPKPERCDKCDGLGRIWDRDHIHFEVEESAQKSESWRKMIALYRSWQKEGAECSRCEGNGKY